MVFIGPPTVMNVIKMTINIYRCLWLEKFFTPSSIASSSIDLLLFHATLALISVNLGSV